MMNHDQFAWDSLKAIIFDFDGVILESATIKSDAFVEMFAEYPEHQPAILEYHLQNMGLSRYHKFEWIYHELLGRELGEAEKAHLGERFSALVLDKILACPFVPGALDTLEAMQGQLLAFVASGTPQAELEGIVAQRGLAHYFTEVWGSPRSKEQIVRDLLQRYALRPDEVLFIGDAMSDFRAAQATGLHFLARETEEMAEQWVGLGVTRSPDLILQSHFPCP